MNANVAPTTVAAHIKKALNDPKVPFLRFYITIADNSTIVVLPQPKYEFDDAYTTVTIDISTVVTDKKLTIALDTGVITLASNTIT